MLYSTEMLKHTLPWRNGQIFLLYVSMILLQKDVEIHVTTMKNVKKDLEIQHAKTEDSRLDLIESIHERY